MFFEDRVDQNQKEYTIYKGRSVGFYLKTYVIYLYDFDRH